MQLDIVTPKGRLLQADVDEFTAPGALGEMGVLPGHIPFLGAVRPGVVRWRRGGETGAIAVGPGFLEVGAGDRCVILTQQGAPAADIDVGAARAELAEVQKRLDHWDDPDAAKRTEAEARRDWAQARLDAAGAGAAAAQAGGGGH